jgi:hypothetical protein
MRRDCDQFRAGFDVTDADVFQGRYAQPALEAAWVERQKLMASTARRRKVSSSDRLLQQGRQNIYVRVLELRWRVLVAGFWCRRKLLMKEREKAVGRV